MKEANTTEGKAEASERKELEREKIALAKKLGIWETFTPKENYTETEEYKRIKEIDKRLSEIING